MRYIGRFSLLAHFFHLVLSLSFVKIVLFSPFYQFQFILYLKKYVSSCVYIAYITFPTQMETNIQHTLLCTVFFPFLVYPGKHSIAVYGDLPYGLDSSFLCLCYSLFNQSLVDGHLGYFQSFAVMSLVMNSLIHISPHIFCQYFWELIFPRGTDGSKSKCICNFARYCKVCCHQSWIILCSQQQYTRGPTSPQSYHQTILYTFGIFANSKGKKWGLMF